MSLCLEVGRRLLVRADTGSQMDRRCKVMLSHLAEVPKETATRFFGLDLVCFLLHSGSQRNSV